MDGMGRTISSLALLKVLWDRYKKDYIEIFVPFIATLIKRKNYKEIKMEQICTDFREEFGIEIPYHPMITILNRATKRGIIRKSHGKYIPERDGLIKYDFTDISNKQIKRQNEVIKKFRDFCKERYEQNIGEKQAEDVFIAYLKKYDWEILFAAVEEGSPLPNVKVSKEHMFLVSKFIEVICKEETAIFDSIIEIANGHILASVIFYNMEFKRIGSNLKKVNCNLDTRFILRLLGTEGEERKRVYCNLLEMIRRERSNLYIFKHTHEEIGGILENCRNWVANSAYDPSRASISTRHFVEQGYTQSDIDRLVNVKYPQTLGRYFIKVVDTPESEKHPYYQIDENQLKEAIVERYKKTVPDFEEFKKEFTIQKDINSISAVNILRKGRKPRTVKEAEHVFITTNSSLAFANKNFEDLQMKGTNSFQVPVCLTDVFIGTFIWLQSPSKDMGITKRKIIADAYAALQPDRILLKRFVDELKKLRKDGEVSDEEFYVLRTSQFARNALVEATKGNPDNFSPRTPLEVLEEMRREGRKEVEEKYLLEKRRREETEEEFKEGQIFREKVKGKVSKMSKYVSWGFFVILFGIIYWGLWGKVTLIILFVSILGIVFGFNLMGVRKRTENGIKKWLLRWLER